MLVQLPGHTEVELFPMPFGAIVITVTLIFQKCATLGVQGYNGGLSLVCWRSVKVSPREPHKAAANDPHFLCTDGQLLWVNVSRGEGPCLDFQATFQ